MAVKKNKPITDAISVEGELLNAVSYATYYCRMDLFTSFHLCNNGKENIADVTVAISGSTPLILPVEIAIAEIPHESSLSVSAKNLLNPKYLAEIEEKQTCLVSVKVTCQKEVLCNLSVNVDALPIDRWSGLSGNVEMLSTFVRPKITDCQKILAEAGLQLKSWGYSSEWSGYAGNDKNGVRGAVAAIYSAIKNTNIERAPDVSLDSDVHTGDITMLIEQHKATNVEMALFFASCLEAAKINPVIMLGKSGIAVGAWLYESCFTSTIQDDMTLIERYITDGINNLTLFDVADLFAHKNAGYSTSEAHFLSAIRAGEYELLIDVKRCRIGGVFPLPLKIKTSKGYELLDESRFAYDRKPDELLDTSKLNLEERTTSKDKSWQRRLLDLSQKNNLLNFRVRDAIHLQSGVLEPYLQKIEEVGKFTLSPPTSPFKEVFLFGMTEKMSNMTELISIEMGSGVLRAYANESNLTEQASALIRKGRATQEEVGDNTLFMAIGFLKWQSKEDGQDKYAPILLLPVQLKKHKSMGMQVECGDDYTINTTLLEFMKQEFGIDLRGIEGKNLTPQQILSTVRAKTSNMKSWRVYEDIYLSQFTFARYAMWSDVKNNINLYKKNPLIASLLSNANKLQDNRLISEVEDDSEPCEVLTPLVCDSSQYSAVAESAKGTTFVLHGPPGTGKSQTITNIIANAVAQGKRVLFVAEKQAALQVVKKRLNEVGIGDFCLELHSGKSTDRNEIIHKIEQTLSLASTFDEESFATMGTRIKEMRTTLKEPLTALHKKRRLGVSVYEGILYYLQNKNAPELVNIESTFYDSLTKSKLEECEQMLSTAQIAARECGGVYRSPFDNVNVTECSTKTLPAIICSAEVLLAELKHLKNYVGLFLDTFNQKISTFTYKKLDYLLQVAQLLNEDKLKHFWSCDEEQLYKFFNANLRYDKAVKHWLTQFRGLPDIEKFAPQIESELENWGENYRSSKLLLTVLKRISRCGGEIPEKEEVEWIRRANEIEEARKMIMTNTKLSQNFTALGGGINERKREEFMRTLYDLHAKCSQIFMDYNADSFNSVCVGANGGYLKPLLVGLIQAIIAFVKSSDHFITVIKADKNLIMDEDLFDYFTSKCSALIDNIDLLPSWSSYKATAQKLNESGLTFITDAMESGKISGDQILSSFRKNVYRNFIQTNIPADEHLSEFSASILDEGATNFAQMLDAFSKLTKQKIRHSLISRLPSMETEGPLALEVMSFQRQIKSNLKKINLRTLFTEIPELMKVVAPCMLMSPFTVSQYLQADPELFDIVIFDEASQLPTCEAVPSLARAKSAIIVGDPKQLPPTNFFIGNGVEEENPEIEDLESLLEDCLALGIPEKHLVWHYRSKHESLIAFSNIMYYSSHLCTFPSPDALDSKVKLHYVEHGVYERGEKKYNRLEAQALVEEVIRRLKDEKCKRSSMGIVTFSTPQQIYIERLLGKAIADNGLESVAYEREEPIFVKNLENVQGDERDVILFSVCYGPDNMGKISLNFGPLNQFGGWRRLNVAVSRAREEMIIFSSMRYSMIDLSRTNSRGVAGLKAFLEFAEKGRTNIAVKSDEVRINKNSIGKYVAAELSAYGYECRCDVGVSDFKIDVAVVDPTNKHNFILAVLCDGTENFSVKDRSVMQINTLKRNNWNVIRLYAINFFNNPKREIKKIKEYLDKLTSNAKSNAIPFKKNYRLAKVEKKTVDVNYIVSGENDLELIKTIKAVVTAEEPISHTFLVKRVLSLYGITKTGVKIENKMRSLISHCDFGTAQVGNTTYYYKNEKVLNFDRWRVEEGAQTRVADGDFTVYDILSLIKGILLTRVSMYRDELVIMVMRELRIPRITDKLTSLINSCIDYGSQIGILIVSISDKISLN